jgi:hypothetical protein
MKRRVIIAAAAIIAIGGLVVYFLLRQQPEATRSTSVKRGVASVAAELSRPRVIFAELPASTPSPGPSPSPTPLDKEFQRELDNDIAALRSSIHEVKERLAADIRAVAADATAGNDLNIAATVEVVRELDFSGWAQEVVQKVMQHYGMRVERRYVASFSPNTFLSKATVAGHRHFYAARDSVPGIYEVFELTPSALARMSALEEAELRKRGWQPDQCLTSRVVFGIVPQPNGDYDLGVLAIEAQPIP